MSFVKNVVTRLMSGTTSNLPAERLTLFNKLVNNDEVNFLKSLYASAGHEIRIAGGAVRDLLTGKLPHDIDFATTATPEESKAILENHDNVRVRVTRAGERHGTVTALINRKTEFEITTLRCDIITDGRHAEVEFVKDWRIDAERRDLTFNAMFLTLNGELIDFFDGASDLESGIVRFVGDAERRIEEDYLRILRYFRFWSRYGRKRPDEHTLKVLQDHIIKKDGLDNISGERIWSELKRIFEHLPCVDVVELMLELKLFYRLGVHDSAKDPGRGDVGQLDPSVYDKYSKSVLEDLRLIQLRLNDFALQSTPGAKLYEPIVPFATLIRSQKQLENAHRRMKWSNFERDFLLYVLDNKDCGKVDLDDFKRRLALEPKSNRLKLTDQMVEYMKYCGRWELISDLTDWTIPDFPLDTRTIIDKIPPPKRNIQITLAKLKNEWANSGFKMTESDLLKLLEEKRLPGV